MYKYSNIRVREIADTPTIRSFEESIGMRVDWSQVQHMRSSDGFYLDLNKAKTPAEAALFLRLTKAPTKQGRGEKRQKQLLQKAFPGLEKLEPGSTTMLNGKKILASDLADGVQDDLDFSIDQERVLITGKDVDERGGGQDDQFDEMVRLIERAGMKYDNDSWVLGIYLNGSLWDSTRKEYRNFQTKYKFPTSLRNLLSQMARGKKVVIFSDNELPKKATTFRTHFGV